MNQKKFCTYCGTPAAFDAVFCTNCGNKFPPATPAPKSTFDTEATVSLTNPGSPRTSPTPTISTFAHGAVPAAEATVNGTVNVPQSFIPDLKPISPTAPVSPTPVEEETVATAPIVAPVEVETVATAPAVAPVEEAHAEPVTIPENDVTSTPDSNPGSVPALDNEATVSVGQGSDSHIANGDVTISVNTPDISNLSSTAEKASSDFNNSDKPAKKKSSAGNVITTIISIILAIVLIVPVFATAMIGAIGNQLSDEAINYAVGKIDTYVFVKDNVLTEYTLGETGYTGFTAYMYSIVYNNDNPQLPKEDYVDFENRLSEIFNDSEAVDAFVESKLIDIREDLKNDTSNTTIEAKEFTDLVKGLKDSIENEFSVTMNDQAFDKISQDITDSAFDKISLKEAKEGNERTFTFISYVLSDLAFYIMLAVSVLLLLIVVFVNGKRFQKGLIIGGVSLGISGGITFVLSVYLNTILGYLNIPEYMLESNIIRMFLGKLSTLSAWTTVFLNPAGIVILGGAALLIIAGIVIAVIKCILRKKKLNREGFSQ